MCLVLVALVATLGVGVAVVLLANQQYPARLAANEQAPPTSASTAPTPTAAPAGPRPTDLATTPCVDAASFQQSLETSLPGFTARRGISRYELIGCEQETALAQGIIPEQDSLFVGLVPRGARYTVDTWAPGTECREINDLPRRLATAFCAEATSEAAAATTTSTTAGDCAADTTDCPPGYQEGVTSSANPYGCDFNAISAENPCMWRYDNQEGGGPGVPTPVTAAQRWAVCHLSGYDQFC